MTSLLDHLDEPRAKPGELGGETLELRWDNDLLTLVSLREDSASVDSRVRDISLQQVVGGQLSHSETQHAPGFWARLFGRPGKREELLHVELRIHGEPRVRLTSEVPRGMSTDGVPRLEASGERVPGDGLVDLVSTLLAGGARLVTMARVEAWTSNRDVSLDLVESIDVSGFAGCYRVGSQVIYLRDAEVAPVDGVEPHTNADKLEIVRLGSRQFVARKGQLSVGKRVAFFAPGTVVPNKVAKALGIARYLVDGKVEAIEIRERSSEGLVLPLDRVGDLEAVGAVVLGSVGMLTRVNRELGADDRIWVEGSADGEVFQALGPGDSELDDEVLFLPAGADVPRKVIEALGVRHFTTGAGHLLNVIKPSVGWRGRVDGLAVRVGRPDAAVRAGL